MAINFPSSGLTVGQIVSLGDRSWEWDGEKWNMVSDWIEPMRDIVRPMIEKAAAAYAAENNITPRDCSKEG